jgi:hypothetical protein
VPVDRGAVTAAARDGRTSVRAGMEEWLRRGPNKRMTPNRRAKCRQTRYPDPKLSTVHENGASPLTFNGAVLYVRRVKNGTPSTHPFQGDELLRRLQRENPSPFVIRLVLFLAR